MASDNGLLGQWDLAVDGRDTSGHDRHAVVHGSVAFGPSLDDGRSGSVARIARGHGHLEVSGIRAPTDSMYSDG